MSRYLSEILIPTSNLLIKSTYFKTCDDGKRFSPWKIWFWRSDIFNKPKQKMFVRLLKTPFVRHRFLIKNFGYIIYRIIQKCEHTLEHFRCFLARYIVEGGNKFESSFTTYLTRQIQWNLTENIAPRKKILLMASFLLSLCENLWESF